MAIADAIAIQLIQARPGWNGFVFRVGGMKRALWRRIIGVTVFLYFAAAAWEGRSGAISHALSVFKFQDSLMTE